ncbi:MAG: flagellar basal body-associated FliL family protein [Magnetococcales bacterium]|nr:flagellar basal body-associated FliL family protein [Magnetococcales bacterium]
MAAEAEQEEKEGGSKGGIVKLLILVIPPLLIGLGGGYIVGQKITMKAVEEEKKKEPKPEEGPSAKDPNALVGPIFKLEPFVVNLAEPRGNRYLKVAISMEMENDALKPEMERRQPQIQDIILSLLTSKSTQELQSLEGKFRLREELLSRINALLVNGKVKRLYFTDFVIQ